MINLKHDVLLELDVLDDVVVQELILAQALDSVLLALIAFDSGEVDLAIGASTDDHLKLEIFKGDFFAIDLSSTFLNATSGGMHV